MRILVTGGCGFIGSHFVRHILARYPDDLVVNLDALTYAGKTENLDGVSSPNYYFFRGNICDKKMVSRLFDVFGFDAVVNFAAETHVDNSIKNPAIFATSNIMGVQNLLDCARSFWEELDGGMKGLVWHRFLQVSTDEVYGALPLDRPDLRFTESSPIDPSSPYSASKAAADFLAMSYFRTFGMPVLVTRCSNNYGPRQDKEKLIPLMIHNALRDDALPVYGDGLNVRDWLYVEDHCAAINAVLRRARPGSLYNIGGNTEVQNICLVKKILALLEKPESLIQFVTDRPGHDRRYAMNAEKIREELEWEPSVSFEEGLKRTVEWYIDALKSKER